MAADTLRIELTPKEREAWWAGIAIEFSVSVEGNVMVREYWGEHDETFADGCSITIPKRIWTEALPWLAESLARLR